MRIEDAVAWSRVLLRSVTAMRRQPEEANAFATAAPIPGDI